MLSLPYICVAIRNSLWGGSQRKICLVPIFFLKRKLLYCYLGAGKIVCVLCFKCIFKYISSCVNGSKNLSCNRIISFYQVSSNQFSKEFFGSWLKLEISSQGGFLFGTLLSCVAKFGNSLGNFFDRKMRRLNWALTVCQVDPVEVCKIC